MYVEGVHNDRGRHQKWKENVNINIYIFIYIVDCWNCWVLPLKFWKLRLASILHRYIFIEDRMQLLPVIGLHCTLVRALSRSLSLFRQFAIEHLQTTLSTFDELVTIYGFSCFVKKWVSLSRHVLSFLLSCIKCSKIMYECFMCF